MCWCDGCCGGRESCCWWGHWWWRAVDFMPYLYGFWGALIETGCWTRRTSGQTQSCFYVLACGWFKNSSWIFESNNIWNLFGLSFSQQVLGSKIPSIYVAPSLFQVLCKHYLVILATIKYEGDTLAVGRATCLQLPGEFMAVARVKAGPAWFPLTPLATVQYQF